MLTLSIKTTCSAFPFSSLSDPNGRVYQSLVSVRGPAPDDGAQAVPLPRDQLLTLPVGEELLEAASAIFLDDAHVAVVGVPHPSAGPRKGKESFKIPGKVTKMLPFKIVNIFLFVYFIFLDC